MPRHVWSLACRLWRLDCARATSRCQRASRGWRPWCRCTVVQRLLQEATRGSVRRLRQDHAVGQVYEVRRQDVPPAALCVCRAIVPHASCLCSHRPGAVQEHCRQALLCQACRGACPGTHMLQVCGYGAVCNVCVDVLASCCPLTCVYRHQSAVARLQSLNQWPPWYSTRMRGACVRHVMALRCGRWMKRACSLVKSGSSLQTLALQA